MVTWHRGCSTHCGFSTMIPLGAGGFHRTSTMVSLVLSSFSRWPVRSVFRNNYFCRRLSCVLH
jgi:hypothetical protein